MICDLWGRSVRPICEAVRVRSVSPKWEAVWEADRPLTHTGPVAPLPGEAMHLAEDQTASPGVRWEADRPPTRPLTSDSQTDHMTPDGLTDRPLTHTDRTPGEAMRLAVKSVRRARGSYSLGRCAWEADRPVAPLPAEAMHLAEDRTASPAVRERPIGTSDSHWLRQITWQIVWGRGDERPNLASHGLSRPPMHSLTASHGLSRPRTLSLSQSNDWKQGQRVHGRPWEAVRGRIRPLIPSASPILSQNLTFDTNSTSDRSLSDVLKNWDRSKMRSREVRGQISGPLKTLWQHQHIVFQMC